ncbi:D-alanine--D-alanine ligase [Patescibacteria group bacterium]|nr:D-alanine--D-alanine ligase [Patescibacteria group bacterium]
MHGTVVGVLRGGPSSEHDVSLKTGAAILKNLPADRFTARDIFIDRQGVWHERGIPVSPERVLRNVDAIVIGLHGEYGEDGEVQKLLERFGVPYTGSNSLSSYLAMHKVLAKQHALDIELLTPRYHLVEKAEDLERIAHEVVQTFLQPVIVKPVAAGSSVGMALTHGYDPLVEAATAILNAGAGVLIEERIQGREATVGVVEGLRDEEHYVLPPIEIIPPPSEQFFSYAAKYGGETREICPGPFPKEVTKELMRAAKEIHKALGLRHYSRSDFIVSPRGIYYLETNTLPGMTEQSLMPKALAAVGVKFEDFLTHLVHLAIKKKI